MPPKNPLVGLSHPALGCLLLYTTLPSTEDFEVAFAQVWWNLGRTNDEKVTAAKVDLLTRLLTAYQKNRSRILNDEPSLLVNILFWISNPEEANTVITSFESDDFKLNFFAARMELFGKVLKNESRSFARKYIGIMMPEPTDENFDAAKGKTRLVFDREQLKARVQKLSEQAAKEKKLLLDQAEAERARLDTRAALAARRELHEPQHRIYIEALRREGLQITPRFQDLLFNGFYIPEGSVWGESSDAYFQRAAALSLSQHVSLLSMGVAGTVSAFHENPEQTLGASFVAYRAGEPNGFLEVWDLVRPEYAGGPTLISMNQGPLRATLRGLQTRLPGLEIGYVGLLIYETEVSEVLSTRNSRLIPFTDPALPATKLFRLERLVFDRYEGGPGHYETSRLEVNGRLYPLVVRMVAKPNH